MAPNGSNYVQMYPKGSIFVQKGPNGSSWFQMCQILFKLIQVDPDGSKWIQMYKNGSKMGPNGSKLILFGPCGFK